MPRDIDPDVREVKGIFLYDLDDLEKVVDHNTGEREAAALEAQKIVEQEAIGFRCRLSRSALYPRSSRCARVWIRFAGKNWIPSGRVRAIFQGREQLIRGCRGTHYSENC